MAELHLATGLTLPQNAETWVISYVAKRGAGKTYNAAVQAEEMMKAKIPIVVIDGMGIWWGLRVGSEGKGEGLPVVVFGGEHGDLPLVPEKAKEMAKAIVESNISCVLDLSGFSKYAMRKIVTDFINELYRLNRVVRHVFIEEADMFAPQRPIGNEANLCLSAVDNFVRRGGNHNLGVTLITQRSAVLNKDILTQSDCLVILRTLAPQDKKAIQAWVEEQTDEDKTKLKEWYDSLKSLENGEAWVWHPEKPEIFQKVKFRQRQTFHATREFIRKPQATKITLMNVEEFVTKFKTSFDIKQTTIQETKQPNINTKPLEDKIESLETQLKVAQEANSEKDKTIHKLKEENKALKHENATLEPAKKIRDAIIELTHTNTTTPTNKQEIVEEVLRQIPQNNNGQIYTIAPTEKLQKDFQENAKQQVCTTISNLDQEQKQILKFIEALGKNTNLTEILEKGLFLNTTGTTRQRINEKTNELVKLELIRKDKGGHYFPMLKEKINKYLEPFNATTQETEDVYNHIITETLM